MTFRPLAIGLPLGLLCCTAAIGQQYIISTIAGTGTAGFSGDSGAPLSAQLSAPSSLLVDSSSNIYIGDGGNYRVRKISGGTITTVAGNGTAGYSGDMGPATSAELRAATGLALDSSGNLYIADPPNHVVRMVASGGTITTFAGTNTGGYSGDGGAANVADLEFPSAVAVDSSGNVWIADSGNNVIREVVSGTINTVAGGPATLLQLDYPEAIVFDAAGDLYITDTQGRRIVKFSSGTLTVVAGGDNVGYGGDNGPALEAIFNDPMGIVVDPAGNAYVSDTLNSRIRKVWAAGMVTTVAGNGLTGYSGDGGAASLAALNFPRGLAIDSSGKIYIADGANNVIRLLTPVAPAIEDKGVVNAANYAQQISPGSLASLFGTNLAAGAAGATFPLQTDFAGVTVNVNGRAAPILYVTRSQVNFQVPWETKVGQDATIQVNNGMTSNSTVVPVVSAGPGLFTNGAGRAVVQNANLRLNSPDNPAAAGTTIMAYLTGSGPVKPSVADGAPAPAKPPATATSSCTASIGSASATVSFAGLAPGFVGVMQVNIVVPSGLAAGDYALTITVDGQASNSAKISVTP